MTRSWRLARLMLYGGTAAVVLGLSKLHAAYVAEPAYDFTGSSRFAWALAYIITLAVAAYGAGLPDLPRNLGSAEAAAFGATIGSALVVSGVQLVTGEALLPRFVVFGAAVVLTLWYLACVVVAAGGRSLAEERDQVVLVAGLDEAATVADDLRQAAEHPAHLAASLTVDEARAAGRGAAVVERVRATGASVLVLNRAAQADETIVAQAAALHERGIRVRTLSLFYEQWLAKLPLNELERVSLLFDIGELHGRRYARFKRLVDIGLSLVGCVVLALVVPFVVVGDLVANRGPLLYRQIRIGRNGEPFEILKFRTMTRGPEAADRAWTVERDPRITPFGQLLRVSHLDELPQMLNILRGNLSFVGPRPEQPHYVAELVQKLPFYDLRHLVRPGLTGWAQVKYGYASSAADALQKLQYEFYYLRHQGALLDARIIGRTVRSVLGREGR